jgi:hypothetical protein
MTVQATLRSAGKKYSNCAKILAGKIAVPQQPNAVESELLVALGIASDGTRRAAALETISFDSRLMMRDSKTTSVTEIVRFNLAWSGMNALFSRNSIFSLLGMVPPHSELDRFKALYAKSNVPAGLLAALLSNLHSLLQNIKTTYVPGHPQGTAVSVLQVLHEKYTPMQYQNLPTGKKIAQAIATGNFSPLDLPTLIYTMRNWSVHGVMIGSSFRSVPGFKAYIGSTSEALAIIHEHLARKLEASA